jgi:phosphoribosyl-ATP pyrophosphohydrolase
MKETDMTLQEERDRVYRAALNRWGIVLQLDMVQEEAAELIIAVNKMKRAKHTDSATADLIEEMADVYVMLRQLEIAYCISADVAVQVIYKTRRLQGRLDKI